MGRAPCCSKVGLHRGPWTTREDALLVNYIQKHGEGHWRSLPNKAGPWTTREDALLVNYIQKHGEGHWRSLPNKAGLLRCGKSCRLRWLNYLRPDIKRGNISPEEDDLIIRLHSLLGNRWSLIAGRLPGRTDNEIKNYWNSHLSKKTQVRDHENGSKFKKESGGRKRNVSELSSKRKQKDGEDAATRTKIHAPKARRVSPSSVNISADNSMVGSSSHTGVVDHDSNWSVSDHLEADKNIDGDLAWAPHHYLDDLVQDDLSGQDYSPANIDDMLEEMFGEYQQLLNTDNHAQLLDSFVDSLLA